MSSVQEYWPPIKQAINMNNDPSQPNSTSQVRCPICLEAIAVTSFPHVPPRQGDIPFTDATLGEVLLCGHVLCQPCRLLNEATSSNRNRACPMCRTPLRCIECGKPSKVMPIPTEGSPSSVPAIASEGADHGGRCTECNLSMWFEGNIHQGEWPAGLEDIEPGFVPFFYHVVSKFEQRNLSVSEDDIIDTFATIVRDEFREMMAKRQETMLRKYNATWGQNPWFGDGLSAPAAEAVPRLTGHGQRRQGSTSPPRVNGQTFVAPPASPVETPAHVLVWRQRVQLDEMRNIINEDSSGEGDDDDDDDVDLVPMPPFSSRPFGFIPPLTAESEEEQDDEVSLREGN